MREHRAQQRFVTEKGGVQLTVHYFWVYFLELIFQREVTLVGTQQTVNSWIGPCTHTHQCHFHIIELILDNNASLV